MSFTTRDRLCRWREDNYDNSSIITLSLLIVNWSNKEQFKNNFKTIRRVARFLCDSSTSCYTQHHQTQKWLSTPSRKLHANNTNVKNLLKTALFYCSLHTVSAKTNTYNNIYKITKENALFCMYKVTMTNAEANVTIIVIIKIDKINWLQTKYYF